MATTTKKTVTPDLPKSVFAVEAPNHELLKSAYEAYLANGRENHAKTLRRGEVSGGGKKPHKQKGTGRARSGSIRNPIWRKGGVVFGPLGIENYRKELPLRAKRTALRQALSLAARDNEIIVIDEVQTTGKTKEVIALLDQHELSGAKQLLLVVDHKTPELTRATNNIPSVILTQAVYLNVFNILNADKLIITKPALAAIEKWLGASL